VKIDQLRNMSKEELLTKQKSLKVELFKLNQQRFGGRVEKPHQFSLVRRDLARIATLLRSNSQTKA
jgi:ribosomal protein L29